MSGTTVRPLKRGDEAEWRHLWCAYLSFYNTKLPDAQYVETFERLLGDDPWQPSSFVAERNGAVFGIVHYLFHSHCWRLARSCYLQDLFVDADARGSGAGAALIEAVRFAAEQAGSTHVYWMTQVDNARARALYDRVAISTGIIYEVRP